MINNKYLWVVVVVIIGVLLYKFGPSVPGNGTEALDSVQNVDELTVKIDENSNTLPSTSAGVKGTSSTANAKPAASATAPKSSSTSSPLPEIEFINKRLTVGLKNYEKVTLNLEKIAFGRGDAAESTGCIGIPNANFSTYLYPGGGICVSTEKVDGSPRGIVAVHAMIDNKSNYAFGGSDSVKLHYLRADSNGKLSHRFAYPLLGLNQYSIQSYSSKDIVLSYLVPADQTAFDLLINYKGELNPDIAKDVYQSASEGLFIDFKADNVSLIK